MDLFTIVGIFVLLVFIFVATQTVALYFFLKENEKLREEAELNTPPF